MSTKWARQLLTEGEVTEVTEHRVMIDRTSIPRGIFDADVAVGDYYLVETVLGSRPSAAYKRVTYKSDAELDSDQADMSAKINADRITRMEENRADWIRREALLPKPLRARLENFRAKAAAVGNNFDIIGWGYELVVSELAVIYAEQGKGPIYADTDEINQYARREGTSGNQHDVARVLARVLHSSPDVVRECISALTPLGTGPYYDAKDAGTTNQKENSQ